MEGRSMWFWLKVHPFPIVQRSPAPSGSTVTNKALQLRVTAKMGAKVRISRFVVLGRNERPQRGNYHQATNPWLYPYLYNWCSL
ncbi:hypothetical protein FKM82_007937 [Ascaphus truei]